MPDDRLNNVPTGKVSAIDCFKSDLRELSPGCFALAMATGIVSIAAHFEGFEPIAKWLFVINNIFYAGLVFLTLARLVCFRDKLVSDLIHHGTAPGFLTIVAATCVLGSQYVILMNLTDAATVLLAVGFIFWLILIYTFFASVTLTEPKPTLDAGLGGAWLLATVATQSLSVLGTLVAPDRAFGREELLFASLAAFLLGCMFYLLIITMIVYRFSFHSLPPEALTPPYWINMGAVAITTLAGSRLILASSDWTLLEQLRPFLMGFTLFFWATATWWIPLLLILGVWRHGIKHFSLVYTPQYWSLVFPLGMYTTATVQLSRALDLSFLMTIPDIFIYFSLFAWLMTLIGMVVSLARRYLPARH